MKRVLFIGALVLGLAAGFYVLFSEGGGEGSAAAPPSASDKELAAEEPVGPAAPLGRAKSARTEAEAEGDLLDPAPSATTQESSPREPKSFDVRGRVLDPSGTPIAGVGVKLRGTKDDSAVPTDGSGAFRMQTSSFLSQRVLTVAGDHVAIRESVLRPTNVDREHLLVAGARIYLSGRVVDEGGVGVVGANVFAVYGDELLDRFPHALDGTNTVDASTRTKEEGRFFIPKLAAVDGALLTVDHPDYEKHEEDLPLLARDDLTIELRAAEEQPRFVEGVVLLPDRSPAIKARVQYDDQFTRTDLEGRFQLRIEDWVAEETVLAAGMKGYTPAVVLDFGLRLNAARPAAPDPFELVLGEGDLAIAGTVLDEEGRGLANWSVSLLDATVLTPWRVPPVLAEGLAGDVRGRTDADGRFRLTGLRDKEYGLLAFDPQTLLHLSAEGVRAGREDVVLRLEADSTYASLRGTVFSRTGSALSGVAVAVGLVTTRTETGTSWESVDPVITDESGGFVLEDVPRRSVHLDVQGDAIIPEKFELDDVREGDELRLIVARRCRFRVETDLAEEGVARIKLLDGEGESLPIYSIRGGGWSSSSSQTVRGDSTPFYAVSEDARTLVVEQEGVEVRRQEIALDPDVESTMRIELGQNER